MINITNNLSIRMYETSSKKKPINLNFNVGNHSSSRGGHSKDSPKPRSGARKHKDLHMSGQELIDLIHSSDGSSILYRQAQTQHDRIAQRPMPKKQLSNAGKIIKGKLRLQDLISQFKEEFGITKREYLRDSLRIAQLQKSISRESWYFQLRKIIANRGKNAVENANDLKKKLKRIDDNYQQQVAMEMVIGAPLGDLEKKELKYLRQKCKIFDQADICESVIHEEQSLAQAMHQLDLVDEELNGKRDLISQLQETNHRRNNHISDIMGKAMEHLHKAEQQNLELRAILHELERQEKERKSESKKKIMKMAPDI